MINTHVPKLECVDLSVWPGIKTIHQMSCVCVLQPLHKGLDPANLEQLITPLTTLGHLAQLAPEQFAAPLKSLVANFIVKDLLMNDRVHTSHVSDSPWEPGLCVLFE